MPSRCLRKPTPAAEIKTGRDEFRNLSDWEYRFPNIAAQISMFAVLVSGDGTIGAGQWRELNYVHDLLAGGDFDEHCLSEIVVIQAESGGACRFADANGGEFAALKPFRFQHAARFQEDA